MHTYDGVASHGHCLSFVRLAWASNDDKPTSPPEAQTYVHSDDKHLTQRALTQVASDQRAYYKSDLAEASELIMKRLVHYGKGRDGGEHVFDYRSVPGHRRGVLPLGLGKLASWRATVRRNHIVRSEVGWRNIGALGTEWVIAR